MSGRLIRAASAAAIIAVLGSGAAACGGSSPRPAAAGAPAGFGGWRAARLRPAAALSRIE
jgi:hypothetical protein